MKGDKEMFGNVSKNDEKMFKLAMKRILQPIKIEHEHNWELVADNSSKLLAPHLILFCKTCGEVRKSYVKRMKGGSNE